MILIPISNFLFLSTALGERSLSSLIHSCNAGQCRGGRQTIDISRGSTLDLKLLSALDLMVPVPAIFCVKLHVWSGWRCSEVIKERRPYNCIPDRSVTFPRYPTWRYLLTSLTREHLLQQPVDWPCSNGRVSHVSSFDNNFGYRSNLRPAILTEVAMDRTTGVSILVLIVLDGP